MSNKTLAEEIYNKVKELVHDDFEPIATSNDHIGVKYIVNYQDLLKEFFDLKWQGFEDESLVIAQDFFSIKCK